MDHRDEAVHASRLAALGLRPYKACMRQPAALVRVAAHDYANVPLYTAQNMLRTKSALCRYIDRRRRPDGLPDASTMAPPSTSDYATARRFALPPLTSTVQRIDKDDDDDKVEPTVVTTVTSSSSSHGKGKDKAIESARASSTDSSAIETTRGGVGSAPAVSSGATNVLRAYVAQTGAQPVSVTAPATTTPVTSSLSDLVRPCVLGAVERCCLQGLERCDAYVVAHGSLLDGGRYGVPVRQIGEGGYGAVLVTDTGYVVKCSKPRASRSTTTDATHGGGGGDGGDDDDDDGSDDDDVPRADVKEMSIVRNLVHPNVVTFLQVSLERSPECATAIAMPHYERSLRDVLRTGRLTDGSKTANVVRRDMLYQLARALAFVHSRHVWHLDVKPENVLLDGSRLALADFGLAQGVAFRDMARNTGVFSMPYRPPELLLGCNRFDASADMWALGITWLRMLGVGDTSAAANDLAQLQRVFALVGATQESRWSDVARRQPQWHAYVEYAREHPLPHYVATLDERLDAVRERLLPHEAELLRRLLALAPSERVSAYDTLQHRFFDDVRARIEQRVPAPPLPAPALVGCHDVLLAVELAPVGDYLARRQQQPHVAKAQFATLAAWLHEVNAAHRRTYGHRLSTLTLAVDLMHRALAAPSMAGFATSANLQALGGAAYMVASKVDSVFALRPRAIARLIVGASPSDIAALERRLLVALDMDLDRPTAGAFYRAFAHGRAADGTAPSAFATSLPSSSSSSSSSWLPASMRNVRAHDLLARLLGAYDTATRWRGSQLAYAALRATGFSSSCLEHYARRYPALFNAAVVRDVVQSAAASPTTTA